MQPTGGGRCAWAGDRGSRPRQLTQTRKARAKGDPLHVVVHEDVLVFTSGMPAPPFHPIRGLRSSQFAGIAVRTVVDDAGRWHDPHGPPGFRVDVDWMLDALARTTGEL